MAIIEIHGQQLDIDLAIFDKDGTLIDFHLLWGQLHQNLVDALKSITSELPALEEELNLTLGFDTTLGKVIVDSPLAIANNRELDTLAAGALFRAGLNWTEANLAVTRAREAGGAAWPTAELVKPLGAVTETFKALQEVGVKVAVATSDDRAATEETLRMMDWEGLVDILVCGDDPFPHKPDPAGYELICRELAIDPKRSIMVGDTLNDLLFGQNGGALATLGIYGGAGDEATLRRTATWVATSIEVINVNF